MEATLLSSHPQFFATRHAFNSSAIKSASVLRLHCPRYAKTPRMSLTRTNTELRRSDFVLPKGLHHLNMNGNLSLYSRDQQRGDCMSVKAASADSLNQEIFVPNADDSSVDDEENLVISYPRPQRYKNRYLNFVRMGTLFNNAAESFFKSEIRRRLFVTAVLLVMSRVGYFIPLPGFDRKLMPDDYLRFVSGSNSELSTKPQLRQIYHKDWAAQKHEMQKIFLDSPKKSCGTGFFLPRSVATDFPLNKSDMGRSSENWNNNNATGNKKGQRSVANKTSSSPQYVYLPKEWTC